MNENSPENLGEVDRLPGGRGRRRLQLPLVAVIASARGRRRERVWPSSRASALAWPSSQAAGGCRVKLFVYL